MMLPLDQEAPLSEDNLIGLIPAAGKGSRLGLPFPKELYPTIINDQYKPIAHYMVDHLTIAAVRHIVFVINESKHQLIKYFGGGHKFNCNISYVAQETLSDKPSSSPGLANALASAYHLIKDKTVLFGMADTIMWPKEAFTTALSKLDQQTDVLLMLFPTEFPHKFGMVSFNEALEVEKIIDKPKETDLKYMWGAMIWRPPFSEILYSKVTQNESSDFANIINFSIKKGLLVKAEVFADGKFVDFGTYEQIHDAESIEF